MTLELDMRQWKAASRELFKTSSRSLEDFTNGQALKVAVEAVRNTEFASPERIAYELGQTGSEIKLSKSRKTGQTRFRKVRNLIRDNSLASRILGRRMNDTGSWGIKAKTLDEAVRKLINSRRRSAHFIQSGWIPAQNILWSVVKRKPVNKSTVSGAKVYGKPKGTARPALFSWARPVFADVVNSALMTTSKGNPGQHSNPSPIAEKGLRKALQIASASMIQKLAERLQPDFRKASAK